MGLPRRRGLLLRIARRLACVTPLERNAWGKNGQKGERKPTRVGHHWNGRTFISGASRGPLPTRPRGGHQMREIPKVFGHWALLHPSEANSASNRDYIKPGVGYGLP